MTLFDWYVLRRFLFNFVVLLLLVFVLGASIDLVVQLDEFTAAARTVAGEDANVLFTVWTLVTMAVDFHGPRLFQFYAYLLGLCSVGAMAFTFSQMHRYKELIAVMASGVSLYRVAWPVLIAAFALNVLHLFNSNMILPQLAPRLLRSHGDLTRQSVRAFEVPLVEDGQNALLHAALFDPETRRLSGLTVMLRDEAGRSMSHITADGATWSAEREGWLLEGGRSIRLTEGEAGRSDQRLQEQSIDFYKTDLGPDVLTMLRYDEFAQMLSLAQIQEMIESEIPVDTEALARIKYGRFSVIFSNLLLLVLSLPFFLLREPANLLRQSLSCAAVTLPVAILTFVLMEVELSGIYAGASVFLPPILIMPLALLAVSLIKT